MQIRGIARIYVAIDYFSGYNEQLFQSRVFQGNADVGYDFLHGIEVKFDGEINWYQVIISNNDLRVSNSIKKFN